MNSVEINKEFYNRLYKKKSPFLSVLHSYVSFDQQSKSKINYKIIKNFLQDKLKQPLAILDYGFGHGSLLLKYDKIHTLYGSDISDEAVLHFPEVARWLNKKAKTASVSDFIIKYGDVKFDIITISHVIEHVEDDIKLMSSLAAMLSDTGIILVNVPINEIWQDPKHVRKYDLEYMSEIMNACHLKVLSTTETDKLTSFFLSEEMTKQPGMLKRIFLKGLRAFFAIFPLGLTKIFENSFLQAHKNQQLIVLATKS